MTFLETLNDYKSRGLLMNQSHPTLPLIIWNYTPMTQYGGLWDEITLQCRGLVTDDKGNIVAKGFSKFFNIEEERHVATNEFEIFEKLDGFLILVFWYDGEMVVTSRGSFTSKYAIEARRVLEEKYPDFENNGLNQFTYCFELIGFEQIVVAYPESDLILTGVFYRNGSDILANKLIPNIWDEFGIKIVKKFDGLDWKNIKQLNWQNAEGFVVRFSNGQRCKIKFEDYIQLHRQMTNLSTIAIWEALSSGESVSSILTDVPDEFYGKVKEYEDDLQSEFDDIELQCQIIAKWCATLPTRKDIAEHLFTKKPKYATIIFAILDGKDYSKMIWKLIKPKFEKI